MEAPITLIKGDKVSVETDYRDALPVNMYAVEKTILGANGYMLCYPGLTSFATGLGIDRGSIYNERLEDHYRVSGTDFISVSSVGAVVDLGNITGTLQAAMPYSFLTQAIIADGKMWLYTVLGGLVETIDADLGDPIDGVWIDGYYFLTDGEYIYHTDLTDESAIDPLKFATAEFMPDKSLGVGKTQDNKAVVFGRYSIEYFSNTANANFAFTRLVTRAQNIGIVATHAKCQYVEKWFITGGPKQDAVGVYMLTSGSYTKISTREIDKVLAGYTEPELADMRMEVRTENDITFVLVHLPDYTLCFNANTGTSLGKTAAWSILKTDVVGNNTYRAINGVLDARNSTWLYGDKRSTYIGKLDNTVFTHYDAMVEWILYSPFLGLEGFSIDQIEVETIPGHTTTFDGTVAISLTYDGFTYGTEAWIDYGDPLEYDKRFIVRRLGYVNDWVGIKLRGATKSRMAFGLLRLTYG